MRTIQRLNVGSFFTWARFGIILFLLSAFFLHSEAQALMINRSFDYQSMSRWYLAYIPSSTYKKKVPTPVVIVLHGGGSTPWAMLGVTGMDGLADQNNFIVVYPAGTPLPPGIPNGITDGLYWNDGRPYVDGSLSAVDDVGFIAAVLKNLGGNYNLDRKRVYVMGISNGAHMCYRLAQQLSDQITAIAAVSGQRDPDEFFPPPPAPMPIIHFHGTQDKIDPYAGGPSYVPGPFGGVYQPVPETLASWAIHNGCNSVPVQTQVIGDAVKSRYTPATGSAEVVLWTLSNGGHTWPGSSSPFPSFCGTTNMDISASQEAWKFFANKSH